MNNKLDELGSIYIDKSRYFFDNNIIMNWYANRMCKKFHKNLSTLDLGLGHGITTNIFSKHFNDYTVIDGSKEVINNFKINNKNFNGTIIESFFENFTSNKKYDLIIMGFILEHVEDPLKILNHYKKLLNQNGVIVIAVPNAEAMNRRLGYYAGLLDNLYRLSEYDHELGHVRYFSLDLLRKLINKAKLNEAAIEGIYLKPFTTNQIKSLNLSNDIIESMCKLGVLYPELSLALLMEIKNSNKG